MVGIIGVCALECCERKVPLKLKGRIYKTVVRPALLYNAEIWATSRKEE